MLETLSAVLVVSGKLDGLEMAKAKVVVFELSIIGKNLNRKSGC